MNRNKLILIVLAIVVAAVVIVVSPALLPTNDADESDPAAQTAPGSDETRNEQTALEAARIMTTWTPAEDFNRTAAEQRAKHLMTKERAEEVIAPERPTTGQAWNQAAEHNATSTPQVVLNPHTETEEGIISVRATWHWENDSEETLPSGDEQRIYYFSFNDDGKIHDYTYETVPISTR